MILLAAGLANHLLKILEPIGLIWLALIVLALLLWRKRLRGFAFAGAAMALGIHLLGATDLSGALLRSLESRYPFIPPAHAPASDAVIMLGGGYSPSIGEVGGIQLSGAGDRLIMALELMRLGKASALVCGGGGLDQDDGVVTVEADLLVAELKARQLGGPEVISLGHCKNTRDEAVRTAALAKTRGWSRLLLVTSAAHLPRAVNTFQTAGLDVVPIPCNYRAQPSRERRVPGLAIPGLGGFEKLAIWQHEQIGWLEYWRRGWCR